MQAIHYRLLLRLVLPGLVLPGLLAGCTQLQYYDQLLAGQYQLMQQRRPLAEVSADPATSDALRERLALARQLRDFASQHLRLPDNNSYRNYADLGRPYAVYNVFAAPELSLEPYHWCYPIIGCASYRGYFDRALAEQEAQRLRQAGYDVYIANIPAYSTLGWFDDPLLNTFIHWPVGLMAELIFHELAHQRLYIDNDTAFNEAFATAVGQLGAQRWLDGYTPAAAAEYQAMKRYQNDFLELVFELREQLAALYASAQNPAAKRHAKVQLFAAAQRRYQALKTERWNGFAGYDYWFGQDLNNAKLAPIGTYYQDVPAFRNLFVASGEDFEQFYRQVEQLSTLPPPERKQRLYALSGGCRGAIRCSVNGSTHRQSISALPTPPSAE